MNFNKTFRHFIFQERSLVKLAVMLARFLRRLHTIKDTPQEQSKILEREQVLGQCQLLPSAHALVPVATNVTTHADVVLSCKLKYTYFLGFSRVVTEICSRPCLRCILAQYGLVLNKYEGYLAIKFP